MNINQIQMAISLLPVSYVIATLIPLIYINIKQSRVPNKIVVPLLLLTLLCWLTLAIWQGKWAELGLSLVMFIGSFVAGFMLSIREWIGMGDVKLISTLSLIVGWFSFMAGLMFIPILFLMSILAVGVIVVLDGMRVLNIYSMKSVNIAPYILASFGIVMWYSTL